MTKRISESPTEIVDLKREASLLHVGVLQTSSGKDEVIGFEVSVETVKIVILLLLPSGVVVHQSTA